MSESGQPDPWVAYAAALWSMIFAVFHILWAFGWYVGLDPEQSRIAFQRPLFFAYDVSVAAICVLGVFVALALVQPWGRRVPSRLLRFCAWAGTGLLVLRAGGSVIQTVYLLSVGRLSFAIMGVWEAWFWLGAILFSVSTWRYVWSAPSSR